MRISNKGVLEIAEHEGIVPAPYRDSAGVWTFGVGHTAAAGDPDPSEMDTALPSGALLEKRIDQALRIFRHDAARYEARVNAAIKVPLAQHQFDALVSFDYNTGGIHRAKLTQAINAGDMSGDQFMGWLKPPEIRKRRMAEQRLFRTGDYDHNGRTIPIWGTDGQGNLTGVVRTIDGDELLARMHGAHPRDETPQRPTKPRGVAALFAAILRLFGRG